jgi:enoyl-CoA hydratase
MSDATPVRLEIEEGVAIITIDRPESRNAMSRPAWEGLRAHLASIRTDTGVLGLIITGSGERAFVAGADIRELVDRPPFASLDSLAHDVLLELEAMPIPTIAAINGHALGGGWELALACDLRVAVSSAKVGFPEVGLGIMPGAGGTLRLLRHVGVGLAKEWILLGTLLDARDALSYGLVNRVVEAGDALAEARRLMARLRAKPAMAIRMATLMVDAVARGDASPDMERLAYTLTFHAPGRAERMRAFLDRRDGEEPARPEGREEP